MQRLVILFLLVCCAVLSCKADLSKVYAAWYCADDGCEWSKEPNLSENAWLTNRGDGQPTVNLVNFAFLNPLHHVAAGVVPPGMTQNAVNYFTSKGIRVVFSIGGEAYSSDWNAALATGAFQLGVSAANIAKRFGVGMEIDYEAGGSESQLITFAQGYRSVIPYESGNNPSTVSILTIDLAAGTGYLSDVDVAASKMIGTTLNWAYAMVSSGPWNSLSEATTYWNQHLSGQSWMNLPPLAANSLVVCVYSSSGATNCPTYSGSVLSATVGWAQQNSVRGIAFWAVGCPAPPSNCANNCPGIQQGSIAYLSGTSATGSASGSTSATNSPPPTSAPTPKPSSTSGSASTSTSGTATGSSSGSVANCLSLNGMYCADSTHFEWCPQQIVQSCGAGTTCQQNGNSIICG